MNYASIRASCIRFDEPVKTFDFIELFPLLELNDDDVRGALFIVARYKEVNALCGVWKVVFDGYAGILRNAIVVVENPVPDDQLEHLKKIFNKQDIRITGGYLNNLELRFNNELARHKLLDLLGDFALLGKRIKGRVWATRPGHFANTEFMKQVKQTIRREGEKPRFQYDCRKPPVYDINDIRRMLPHRPPFLLVDRIFYIDDTMVAGIKNVTMNEPFFVGHFPEEPVMPGVLIVEAMAQCCGMLVLRNIPDPEHYSTYFMKIDGVKFKRKVVPGDTLHFEVQLLEPIRRGVAVVEGKAFVGETLACEATMMAQIVKNKE